jgi:hypothetical protein
MREALESAVLVRHARVKPRGIQRIQIGERILAAQKALQIGGKDSARSGPALANEIEFVRRTFAKSRQARMAVRKAGIVLDPADALLGHGKEQLAITRDAGRRIVHLRIIKPQGDHE